MAKIFQEIIAWQKAHRLVIKIYQATKHFPDEEKFGLTAQMRRSSASIPSNIVEGFHRKGYRDALNFFNIGKASLEELKYQTHLSHDLNYLSFQEYQELNSLEEEVGRLLNSWLKSYYKK